MDSTMINSSLRTWRGSMLILVAAGIFIVILVGLVMLWLTMTLGASNQLQNAVDAGSLNVARQSLTGINIRADALDDDDETFTDVADSKGNFNLENYNRVVGKAMLIAINNVAMAQEDCATEESYKNIDDMFHMLRSIGQQLDKKLHDDRIKTGFFYAVSRQNSVRMMGMQPSLSVVGKIRTGYVDKDEPSNVKFKDDVLPFGFQSELLHASPLKDGKEKMLLGYKPIEVGERFFVFVPQPCRPPHLISSRTFAKSSNVQSILRGAPEGHSNKVLPNAFLVVGQVTEKNGVTKELRTEAASQADSLRNSFVLEVPHGFIRIINRPPVYILKMHKNQNGWGEVMPELPDCAAGVFTKEVKPKLDQDNAWFKLVGDEGRNGGPTAKALERYLQRVHEIKYAFEEKDMSPPLRDTEVPERTTAYTYRDKDDKIQISLADDDKIDQQAPWLRFKANNDIESDGQPSMATTVMYEVTTKHPIVRTDCAAAVRLDRTYMYIFKPGTGVNGCLGDLTIGRSVLVRFLSPGKKPEGLTPL